MKGSYPTGGHHLGAMLVSVLILSVFILPACGFQLYGQGQATGNATDFSQIHLSGDGPSQPMLSAVRLAISHRNQHSATDAETAVFNLRLDDYQLTRRIDNLTPAGIAIEYQLKASASYRLTAAEDGSLLVEGRPNVKATSTRLPDNPVTNQRKSENIERVLIAELAALILVQVEDVLSPQKPTPDESPEQE